MANEILRMHGISKSFPGVKALDKVDFDLREGEVHALLGENGAGKSTLIKVLAGIYQTDEGEIYINGKKEIIDNMFVSRALGISVVHQELCVCENMTVADNIFLGKWQTKAKVLCDFAKLKTDAVDVMKQFGVELDPDEKVGNLSVAQQQMVELARAISENARILVLDEPTDALSQKEAESLFEVIERLKEKGIGIIYISHKIEELFEIGDRVTVLRDGKYVATKNVKETTYNELVNMLIGRTMTDMYPEKFIPKSDEVILTAKDIVSGRRVKGCSFDLRQGEILGFYGLVGAGRTELMRVIYGVDKMDSGELWLNGQRMFFDNPQQALDAGISYVPEDRKAIGLILIQTVGFNMTVSILNRLFKGLKLNKKLEKETIDQYIEKLKIKTPSVEQKVMYLSGGNQQKVVVAKGLAVTPHILIMDEPTRGIDVGAKKEMYTIMKQLAEEGYSIIMVSSELPEIVHMCNRVVVMYEGNVTGIVEGDEVTEKNIIHYTMGGKGDHAGK